MPDLTIPASVAIALKALKPILGPAADEFGAAVADTVRLYRWERQFKILNRANQFLNERGIEAKPVHLKVLVPLLDAASLEDEPELEEMWAKLLASASENNSEKSFYFVCTEILKNISSNEAIALRWMYGKWLARVGDSRGLYEKGVDVHISGGLMPFDIDDILKAVDMSFRSGSVMIDNFRRLNLVEYQEAPPFVDYREGGSRFSVRIKLTQLAIRFMEVCKTNKPSS